MIRIPTDREPTHPGEMLLREFLLPLSMTWLERSECRTSGSTRLPGDAAG